ncbi:NADP-dependent oxidoreductase [Cnuibacter physcomitrellae]|uniref:NADP-dependent oxidoreductase n=1 Tax=Cnuibacter physcomitrellae TaxID=1619308 RepID=UPI00217592E2|nr:NADP-dependent oxidoreductase [Cnuibacter physcomitrellae]MCS5498242.1 NADP-dependent oxidoreductase [Cnuibacter physcomitrellae]
MKNRRWVLADHAEGPLREELWDLVDDEQRDPGPGEVLVESLWLSVDPYMRGKLKPSGGMRIGDVMGGPGVGRVVASAHPAWVEGDLIESPSIGWQTAAIVTPDAPGAGQASRIAAADPNPQSALSWCGMPGYTAYFAMLHVARPLPGDTVVISAAGGAVGQIAGQIAAMAGARVVGIAGSDEKLDWCRSIGFHEVLNYKTVGDLPAEIGRLCPGGVDVFFDATGGAIHDAVIPHLAVRSRVAVVGRVAFTNSGSAQDVGIRASSRLIDTRATVQGFTVYDWWHRRPEAADRLRSWHADGRLAFREDIASGIESVPAAFLRMMAGESLGKQLVAL